MTLMYLFTEETKWNCARNAALWRHLGVLSAHGLRHPREVLLKDSYNPNAICLDAKAVAESAMNLVLRLYLAVKQAICAREEYQLGSDFFQLVVPLSPEAIRTAIGEIETRRLC